LALLEIEEQVPMQVVRNRFITGRTKTVKKSTGTRRERERKGSRTEAAKARGGAPLAVLPVDTRAGCRVQAPLGRGRGGAPSPPGQTASC